MRLRRWSPLLVVLGALVLFAGAVGAGSRGGTSGEEGTPADTFEALAGRVGRAEAWQRLYGRAPVAPEPSSSASSTATTVLTDTPLLTPTVYFPLIERSVVSMVERRAVWVTRYDWTQFNTVPTPESIDALVAKVAGAGFNTIFFQVRAAGDAYYASDLEPWAARLTGSTWETLGQDPGWDPLARMVEQAHAVGLEVHAYVNVYPAWQSPFDETYGSRWPPATTPPQMFDRFTYGPDYAAHPGEYALGYDWRQHSRDGTPMPLNWNAYLWASPGLDQVRGYVLSVTTDIVTRYDVDGLHLDLVRYAGPGYSYDPVSNAAAGEVKTAGRDQWQRERVTDLVTGVHSATLATRPEAWVTAAVWPYYKDVWGWGLSEGYYDYYQDSQGWLASGAVDGIAPMLYGGQADDFTRWQTLMEDFVASSAGGHVYPGIGGNYEDFDEIERRIAVARRAGAPGHALFSYQALEARDFWDDLAAVPYAVPAVVPERP